MTSTKYELKSGGTVDESKTPSINPWHREKIANRENCLHVFSEK